PLLYELVDREISRDDAVWLAEHLAACRACAARLAQIRSAEAKVYARTAAVAPPPDLAGRITETVWASRQAKPSRQTEAGTWTVSVLVLALAAAGLILSPGAGAWAPRTAELFRQIGDLRLDATLRAFFERLAAAGSDWMTALPSPP